MDNDAQNLLLPPDTPVGPYTIRRRLGDNHCSATYLAEDTRQPGSFVWLVESLPKLLVKRNARTLAVEPRQRKLADQLAKAHATFVQSMREMSSRPVNVLHRAKGALQANGTCYVILMPPGGQSLQEWMNSYAKTPAENARRLLQSALAALEAVHGAGLLHLGISPANLLMINGMVAFTGYGRPQRLLAELCERPLMTQQFSAPELGNLSVPPTPAADIFSLGATMRHLITRKKLPALRSVGDGLSLLSADEALTREYGASMLACIDKALSVQPERRWQSAKEWALCLKEERVPDLIGPSPAEALEAGVLPLQFEVAPEKPQVTPVPAKPGTKPTDAKPADKPETKPAPAKPADKPSAGKPADEKPAVAAPAVACEPQQPAQPAVAEKPVKPAEKKPEKPAEPKKAEPAAAKKPAAEEAPAPAGESMPQKEQPAAPTKPEKSQEPKPKCPAPAPAEPKTSAPEEHSIFDIIDKKNRRRKVTICAALAVLALGAGAYALLKDKTVPVGGDMFAPSKTISEAAKGKTEQPDEMKQEQPPVAGPSAKEAPVLPNETTISLPIPEPITPVVDTPPLPVQPAEPAQPTQPDTPVAGHEPQPTTPAETVTEQPTPPAQTDTPVAGNEPQFPEDQPAAPTPAEPAQPAQPDTPVAGHEPQPPAPTETVQQDTPAEPVSDFEALVQQAQQPGNGKAMLLLAQAYAEGKGTEKNDKSAYKWFYEASQKANGATGADLAEARYQTGLCYLQGKGTARRQKEAIYYFTLASEQGGHALAQYNLGKCYLEGIGTKADKNRARLWLNKAAKKGVQEAKELLKSPDLREEPADTRRANRRTRR